MLKLEKSSWISWRIIGQLKFYMLLPVRANSSNNKVFHLLRKASQLNPGNLFQRRLELVGHPEGYGGALFGFHENLF